MPEVYEDGDMIECGKGTIYTYDADNAQWIGFEGEWVGTMESIPQPVNRIYVLSEAEWWEYQELKELVSWMADQEPACASVPCPPFEEVKLHISATSIAEQERYNPFGRQENIITEADAKLLGREDDI